jgi:hypothetical protein
MTPQPVGPAEPVVCLVNRPADQGDEESLDFVAGQRDEVVGAGAETVLVSADDGQEGVGEHGEGDPAGPGRVAAELVLVQSGQTFPGLERLLDPPPESRDPRQDCQGYRLG